MVVLKVTLVFGLTKLLFLDLDQAEQNDENKKIISKILVLYLLNCILL